MAVPQNRIAYIARVARADGMDPKAVLAIAAHEGLSGGVGDGGHAFGPFQMNDAGGVLTNAPANQHSNAWAWSNQGIQFALRNMAQVAHGLTGAAAIRAIATRYERPANPQAEISDAMAHYGKVGLGGPQPIIQNAGMTPGVVQQGRKQFDTQQFHAQAGNILMQQAVRSASGAPTLDLTSELAAARKAATIRVDSQGMPAAQQPGTSGAVGGGGLGARVAGVAARQIGTPYVWGGESKAGFDCSGLVQFAYAKLGINLPRTAAEQGRAGRAVNFAHLKAGDLLVENNGDHVVMYAGNGKVIQAPHTGTNVQESPLSWFPPSQYNARRIVG